MNQIDKILERHKIDISDFEQIRKEFFDNPRIVFREKGSIEPIIPSNKPRECFYNFQEMLFEITRICYIESHIKENLKYAEGDFETFVPKISIYGEESNTQISIGLFRDFYIISELAYPDNLNLMKDDFWELISRLKTYGEFRFIEEPKFSQELKNKHKKLFNKRGHIYKLTRNYFISQIEYGFCNSLGFFEVKWDRDIEFKDIIRNYIDTFKILYQLNYMLWKADGKNKYYR